MAAFLRYKSDQKLVFSYDHCRIQLRVGRTYGTAQLRPWDDCGRFQIQEKAFHLRLWSHASYKNGANGSAPRASLLRGTANRESNPRPPSRPAAGRPRPFLIPPFPYPERLCIMTPYPPQQQERTLL